MIKKKKYDQFLQNPKEKNTLTAKAYVFLKNAHKKNKSHFICVITVVKF